MNDDFAMLLFLFAVSATANVALAVGLWRTARRLRRLERSEALPPSPAADVHTARLEQIVESLSTQVEQLASGQDFLNRVVAERLDKLSRGLPAPDGTAPRDR